ncbi:cytidine deaminase-like [Stomoxys calcitrans]|uniref:cytidine deaminase-like n=1 Tax=Stomoxys calcitrans TaxID=35570 RepID=UPI0027E25C47|nr:cytidine deaminase-like [Stomoxys calcitrans]
MSQYFLNGVKDGANVKEFNTLDAPVKELLLAAVEARKHAYCPYSNFAVGAAIRTTDGSIYTGCNIENGTYTAGICAERIAAAKAISEGKREFIACAVVVQQEDSLTTPCGVCRQFLAEFAAKKDFPIYMAKPISPPFRVLCTSIMELLPKSFFFE